MTARIVTQAVTLWAVDRPDYPIAALLTYDPADPYAVRLAFMRGARETVSYTFARKLLADGLEDAAGHGDVTVGPNVRHQGLLVITLRQADAYPFAVHACRDQVVRFVSRAHRLVSAGCEHEWIDWDAELAEVLGGAS